MKKAGVAILGLGVVGGGTYQILTEKREYFKKTQNVDVTVEAVLELNKERALALGVEESKIAGSIDVKKAGRLILSIPNENGWTLYVDGKEVLPEDFICPWCKHPASDFEER